MYKNQLYLRLEQLVSLYVVKSPIWQEIDRSFSAARVVMHLITAQPGF
ncbi:hypothetical protein [Microcoleus sp. Pol12A5]